MYSSFTTVSFGFNIHAFTSLYFLFNHHICADLETSTDASVYSTMVKREKELAFKIPFVFNILEEQKCIGSLIMTTYLSQLKFCFPREYNVR